MAVAFDAVTKGNDPTRGGTSETFSHTCSVLENRCLIVALCRNDDTTTAADDVTGVTYGGVAMTQLTKINTSTTEPGVLYLYGLLAPATGANNVIATYTGSTGSRLYAIAISYTGVKQSGLPDSVNTKALQASATNFSIATTTIANRSWAIMLVANSGAGGSYSAGASTTHRKSAYNDAAAVMAILDSNAAKTPAGSITLNSVYSQSRQQAGLIVSLAPEDNANVSVSVITATATVIAPSVSGNADVSLSVITATASVQAPTVSTPAPTWTNQSKNNATNVTNQPKS